MLLHYDNRRLVVRVRLLKTGVDITQELEVQIEVMV